MHIIFSCFCYCVFRAPLKARLSLNHTYPVTTDVILESISPVKSERYTLASTGKEVARSVQESQRKKQHMKKERTESVHGNKALTAPSQKSDNNISVHINSENLVCQNIPDSPVKSVRLCYKEKSMPASIATEASQQQCNKTEFDHALENNEVLLRTATSLHENQANMVNHHESNTNESITKPSKPKRQKQSPVKHKFGPKSKRFKASEQCNEITHSTRPANEQKSVLKRKPKKLSSIKQKKGHHGSQHKIQNQQVNSEESDENMQGRSKSSDSLPCRRKKGRVKNDLNNSLSLPSSTTESQSDGKAQGFVFTTEKSLKTQVKNQVHSTGSKISSVMELDEAIPLQSMKSSRMQDKPIWSSILSEFKT